MAPSKQILSAWDKLGLEFLCVSPSRNTPPLRIILFYRGETFQLKARLKWEIFQEELYLTRSVQLEAIIP